uniref:Uncharacterized protein n=1 Tax=Panagrolaimus sp. PS1159 TaxID=55785 RepID=A0AC35F321_9BILA
RVIVTSCPAEEIPTDDCTYPYFSVTDAAAQYAVFINSTCQGSIHPYRDSWISWDKTKLGPVFTAWDNDDRSYCSRNFHNTGWWYNHLNNYFACGYANLNGLRFACGDQDDQYNGQYLMWANSPAEDAFMYLRPREYPNYDPLHPVPTTTSAALTDAFMYLRPREYPNYDPLHPVPTTTSAAPTVESTEDYTTSRTF